MGQNHLNSRRLQRLAAILFLSGMMVGCFPSPPTSVSVVPTESTTEESDATNVAPTVVVNSEPQVPDSVGFAPGTIIMDQAVNLSAVQGNEVALEFDATVGQVVRIDFTLLGGTPQYQMRLEDKYGNFLATVDSDPSHSAETISEITLPFNGTYKLAFTPQQGNGTVKAVVTALGPPSSGGVLTELPIAVNGIMSSAGVYHMYQFPLQAGQTVTVAAKANIQGAPDVRLTLIGTDGRVTANVDDVAAPTDFNAILPQFVAPETGTYTAIVSNYGNATGAYVFSVTLDTEVPVAEGNPDVSYDQTYRAAFGDQSALSASFDGTVGDVIRIDVTDPTPDVDLDIYLFSPFNQIIAYPVNHTAGEGESLAEMQLPYTGRYRLELRPIGSGEASFVVSRLAADALTGGGSFGTDASGTRSGVFESPSVFHVYQFDASVGDKITLSVNTSSTSALDLGMALIGPSGHELAFGDDSEDGLDPHLDGFTISQTGTYTIIVYSFNGQNGSYDITFARN